MIPDSALLRQYAEHRDNAAFAELVRRHVDLVYSVALRQANGDAHLAEDAAQAVFTDLARKARALSGRETLAGWLHTSARFAAGNAVLSEARRRAREHEAVIMHEITSAPDVNWEHLRPLLDEGVGRLKETDRDAIVLRFFEGKSHEEIGKILGLSENSANKRVERALDKLREHFARQGVTTSTALLAATIAKNSVQAAPAGLAARITAPALAASGAVTTGGIFLKILFMSTQAKLIAVAAIVVIAATITLNWPHVEQQSSASRPTFSTASSATALLSKKPRAAAQVALPVAPAVMASDSPAILNAATSQIVPAPIVINTGQTQFTAGPQTDLNAAIVTGIHFLAPPDLPNFAKTLMPLSVVGTDGEGVGLSLEDYVAQLSKKKDINEHLASMLEAMTALDGKTPSLNDTGDRATFLLDPPVGGHKVIIFNKVGGFWYLDGM